MRTLSLALDIDGAAEPLESPSLEDPDATFFLMTDTLTEIVGTGSFGVLSVCLFFFYWVSHRASHWALLAFDG